MREEETARSRRPLQPGRSQVPQATALQQGFHPVIESNFRILLVDGFK